MYLESTLEDPEYVRFRADMVSGRIIDYYNLRDKIYNGYIYAKIEKAWYGLKQAGRIAHDDLVQQLLKARIQESPINTRTISP